MQTTKPASLPTGTVTFLFTDIEGSTQRWDQHRDAMKVAVARHERIVKVAIMRHNGYIFKTAGDSFCAAFTTAVDALAAAVDAQISLAGEDFTSVDGLRVRMGLHSGTAQERGADYFGPVVNRVARLMSIGHGGQVLVSNVTRDLVREHLPANTSFLDLGSSRLKDLSEPEHVWQLCIAGLSSEFPQLRSLEEFPNNLPVRATTLRGRESDLVNVRSLLGPHSVVTLIGAGGVGKTRVALQTAAEMLDRFVDGVWFADISQVNDPELVPSVIGNVLAPSQEQRSGDWISRWLKHKQLLLIVDNCEHLIGAVAALVDAIQQNAPQVRILATSRQPLGIGGEAVYRLPSLEVPDQSVPLKAEDALRYGAVAVFTDRARLADAQFVLTDAIAPIVGDICRQLDGIPLAIELAAARVKVLSPSDLGRRLNERFMLLTGGGPTVLPRQKTLRGAIDWSYELLSEAERALFRRISIFAGTFSLELACALCRDDAVSQYDVLDLVASLVDKSLLQADNDGETRFRLLESIRQYAEDKLDAAEKRTVSHVHAAILTDLAEALDKTSGSMPDEIWSRKAKSDLDNCRAALRWSLQNGNDVQLGQRLAAAMRSIWCRLDPAEGQRWIRAALVSVDQGTAPETVARLYLAQAHMALLLADYGTAAPAATRALEAFTSIGDLDGIAGAQLFAGAAIGLQGDTDMGKRLLNSALDAFRARGQDRQAAAALQYLALLYVSAGDIEAARPLFGAALDIFRATSGAERSAAHIALALAETEFQAGDATSALTLATEALTLDRARHDESLVIFDLCNIAAYLVALDRFDEAFQSAYEALMLAHKAGVATGLIVALQHVAAVLALRNSGTIGDQRIATQLLGFVDARMAQSSFRRDFTEQQELERLSAPLRGSFTQSQFESLKLDGSTWGETQALATVSRIAADMARRRP